MPIEYGWPQIVFGLYVTILTMIKIFFACHGDELSSGGKAIATMIYVALYLFTFGVLHAGGFW